MIIFFIVALSESMDYYGILQQSNLPYSSLLALFLCCTPYKIVLDMHA